MHTCPAARFDCEEEAALHDAPLSPVVHLAYVAGCGGIPAGRSLSLPSRAFPFPEIFHFFHDVFVECSRYAYLVASPDCSLC